MPAHTPKASDHFTPSGKKLCSVIQLQFSLQLEPVLEQTKLIFLGEAYVVPVPIVIISLCYGK